MFQEGQVVACSDEKMDGIGPILVKNRTYTVREFIPAPHCNIRFKNEPARWHENGGRMEVKELPGCYWFGRRFTVR